MICADRLVDDLACDSPIPSQLARLLQPAARLVDGLAWLHAEQLGKFVVIQGLPDAAEFLQDARCDGQAGHSFMIPKLLPPRKPCVTWAVAQESWDGGCAAKRPAGPHLPGVEES